MTVWCVSSVGSAAGMVSPVRSSRGMLSMPELIGMSAVAGAAPSSSNLRAPVRMRVSSEPTVLL